MQMKKYPVIYADPPWQYRVYSKKGLGRSAESHYPTMGIDEIRALPVAEKMSLNFVEYLTPCKTPSNADITSFLGMLTILFDG